MITALRRSLYGIIGLAVLATACDQAHDPVEPTGDALLAPTASHAYLAGADWGDSGATTPLTVLLWRTPLGADVEVTELCDTKRCVIELAEVGVVVTIPPKALGAPTLISVTALAGEEVNMEFAPHGLQFANDIHVAVDLMMTQAPGDKQDFSALYWTTTPEGGVVIEEVVPGTVFKNIFSFQTDHFSGYAVAGEE
jgi:hypothetical protein